jgi:DNA-binding MarR family transcriptional regulator
MHDDSFSDLIRLIDGLLCGLERRDLEYVGMGPRQMRILVEIVNDPGIGADILRRRLSLDKSTVSVALAKLGTMGCIETAPDPYDGRRKLHSATNWGRSLARLAANVESSNEEFLTYGIDPAERTRLRRLLLDMAANLAHELRHPGRRRVIFPADPTVAPDPNQGPAS